MACLHRPREVIRSQGRERDEVPHCASATMPFHVRFRLPVRPICSYCFSDEAMAPTLVSPPTLCHGAFVPFSHERKTPSGICTRLPDRLALIADAQEQVNTNSWPPCPHSGELHLQSYFFDGREKKRACSDYSRCFLLNSITFQNIVQRSIMLQAQALFDREESCLFPSFRGEPFSVFFSQSPDVGIVSFLFFPAGYVSAPFHVMPPFRLRNCG